MSSSDSEIVKLNVGGKLFITRKGILLQADWFITFFSGKFKTEMINSGKFKTEMINKDEYFVDRDPTIFLDVLNYLRNGKTIKFSYFKENKQHFESFVSECEYFGIIIKETWEKLLYSNSKIIKLNVDGKVFVIAKSMLQEVEWFETYFSNTPMIINNNEYFINIDLDYFRELFDYLKDKKAIYFVNMQGVKVFYGK